MSYHPGPLVLFTGCHGPNKFIPRVTTVEETIRDYHEPSSII